MAEQSRRVLQVGVVTSTRMQKTINVLVERRRQHPRYKKYLRERTSYLAHDEGEVAREGDRVEIVQTRPLSKRKRWRLLRVLPTPTASRPVPTSGESDVQEPVAADTEAPVEPVQEQVSGAPEVSESL